ncbi:hypothetical protein KM043_004301 [Ampulex compressa]|nr:hypothetical protein KM043_004301 [Ampulex compressa]
MHQIANPVGISIQESIRPLPRRPFSHPGLDVGIDEAEPRGEALRGGHRLKGEIGARFNTARKADKSKGGSGGRVFFYLSLTPRRERTRTGSTKTRHCFLVTVGGQGARPEQRGGKEGRGEEGGWAVEEKKRKEEKEEEEEEEEEAEEEEALAVTAEEEKAVEREDEEDYLRGLVSRRREGCKDDGMPREPRMGLTEKGATSCVQAVWFG